MNKDEDSTPKLSRGEMRIHIVFSADPAEPDSKTQESTADVPLPARKLARHWSHRISGELRFENSLGIILTRPIGNMNFRLFDHSFPWLPSRRGVFRWRHGRRLPRGRVRPWLGRRAGGWDKTIQCDTRTDCCGTTDCFR